MVDQFERGRQLFALLEQVDEQIARRVAAKRCPACKGPLHRGDYDRKPRGALLVPAGETSVRRFSLCCGREGCRKRALPPSVRFLGRRVYFGLVVIVASLVAQVVEAAPALQRATGVPARTTRRWVGWWRDAFLSTAVFVALRARLLGVALDQLPASVLLRLPGSPLEQMRTMLWLLAPLTTSSVAHGEEFLGDPI